MMGNKTASTINITTSPMVTINSGSSRVASCNERRCTSVLIWRAGAQQRQRYLTMQLAGLFTQARKHGQ